MVNFMCILQKLKNKITDREVSKNTILPKKKNSFKNYSMAKKHTILRDSFTI